MRTTILVFLVVLLALLLAACDERGAEKPDLTFTSDRDTLTSSVPGLKDCNLTVLLDGEIGVIRFKRIDFTYDKAKGTIVGAGTGGGSDGHGYSDSLGVLQLDYVVADSVYGAVMIDAAMEQYPSVHQTLELTVLDCPEVTATCTPDSLPPDGTSQFTINVQLTSHSDNIANKQVNFISELDLENDSMFTDENGQCVNHVTVNDEPDTYSTTITLEDYGTLTTVYHRVVNP